MTTNNCSAGEKPDTVLREYYDAVEVVHEQKNGVPSVLILNYMSSCKVFVVIKAWSKYAGSLDYESTAKELPQVAEIKR